MVVQEMDVITQQQLVPHRNPFTGAPLTREGQDWVDPEGRRFPRINGVWRFVEGEENYTDNFGFQWNKFQKTQIDGHHESDQSAERWTVATGWHKEKLAGHAMLEVGSGAGRFTKVVLDKTEAELYSVDYSSATEANFRNNGSNPRLRLYQASVYELPFDSGSFDKVFCFGVLQHTPDVKKSVLSLLEMAKPGGEVIVDFYPIKGWWTKVCAKYMLRPWTKKMSQEKLLTRIERNAGWLMKWSRFNRKIGLGFMNRFLPICDIERTLPRSLSKTELREWVILDTFDQYSPAYDQPQRLRTVEKWFKEAGMTEVKAEFIHYGEANGVAVVRGRKPQA